MTRINVENNLSLRIFNSLSVGLFYVLIAIFSACRHPSSKSPSYSDEFKPIFDSVSSNFQEHPEQAVKYLDSATKKMRNLSLPDRFRIYAYHFEVANAVKHQPQKAMLYADSMLAIIEQLSDKKLYSTLNGEANFAKGDALFANGIYNEAYTYYYNGYLIGKDNLNDCTLSNYTYRMGMISYRQANYHLAANYFKESFKNGTCNDDFAAFFRQQEVLDNIALSFRNAGMADSALIYYDKAKAFINDHTEVYRSRADALDIARAVVFGNDAEVLNLKGDFKGAADLLKKSIAINGKKGHDNLDAELSEVKLGKIYLDHQQNNDLANLLQFLRLKLDTIKNAEAEEGWNYLAGNYYRQKKDFAKAMLYLDRYQALKDSLAENARPLKESNVNEQLKSIEKQYQIENLKNEQRNARYAAVIFGAMSVIIFLLIYRGWKRSKRALFTVNNLHTQVNEQKINLEHTLRDLERSSQEKDRILRTVAHDLRNPLGGIASLTNAMLDDEGDYSAEQLELVKIIQETSYNSLELINEILEATNNTVTEINKQLVDINTLISNSVELLRFKAAEKNQKIVLHLLKEPEELLISREKIWRVISNLISNAIKFSPTGGTIKVGIVVDGDDVILSVNDHGIGIPDNMRDSIFNMFTDAKRPGTLGEKSFGLGLSICMQIIEKHGGKIWFDSNKKSGTTFFIRLARQKTEAGKQLANTI